MGALLSPGDSTGDFWRGFTFSFSYWQKDAEPGSPWAGLGVLASSFAARGAHEHSLGTAGRDDRPLGSLHPPAFRGQSPGDLSPRRPATGTDTLCQPRFAGVAAGTILRYSHVVEDAPAAVGVPGAQAQLAALVLLAALHRHPRHLREQAGSEGGRAACFPPCPHLDPAETDPAQAHPGPLDRRERAEPPAIARSSPKPKQHICRQHLHPREVSTPTKLLPLLLLQRSVGAGRAGSAPRRLPALARHPVAAAALLRKGYWSFINCSSRFD